MLAVMLFVSVFFSVPVWFAAFLRGVFGYSAYLLPFAFFAVSAALFSKGIRASKRALSFVLLFVASVIFISALYSPSKELPWYESGEFLNSGGYLGELLSFLFSLGLGNHFAGILASVIALYAVCMLYEIRLISKTSDFREKKPRNIVAKLSDFNEYGKRKISDRHLQTTAESVSAAEDGREEFYETERSEAIPSSTTRQDRPPRFSRSEKKSQSSPLFPRIPLLGSKRKETHPQGATADSEKAVSPEERVREHERERKASENPGKGEFREAYREVSERREASEDRKRAAGESSGSAENRVNREEPSNIGHDGRGVRAEHRERHESRKKTEESLRPLQEKERGTVRKKEKRREHYRVPPTQLLEISTGSKADNRAFIDGVVEKLQSAFVNFGVDAKVVSFEEGPTITMFEVILGTGVKISKLQNLSEDIALTLAVSTVRIAPIEGKSSVGIEVPNRNTTAVLIKEMIDTREFTSKSSPLTVVLGKDISGKPVVADLTSMPHLLVAGATGSGKSVCVNAMILSILLNASPEEVRFVMIDPKQVELSSYNEIPHLIMPVVTEAKQAAIALNWVVQEMERRYSLMLELRVKDYKSYNAKCAAGETLPYIVVIVDELADLMMVAAKQVEEAICRIAQKARAAGIHLVVATQRPSVDVITGLIKANIPSRIAFSVSSRVDSGTILDAPGAEKLLGKGDMLYHPVSLSRPKRVQGAFVSTKEIDNVVAFIHSQGYVTDQVNLSEIAASSDGGNGAGSEDEYLDEAILLVRETGKASASMLQRKFSIGYNRAARLIDMMEERGIIGPQQGSKPRDVY